MNPRPIVHVVDDEADVRDVVAKLVESVGLTARVFSSAQDFLASYDGSRPGCVVLDVRMPGMTGIEALTRFAERNIRLPVIMLTGYGDVPTAVRSLKRGAVDFIQKPFDYRRALDIIRGAFERDAEIRARGTRRAGLAARLASLTEREREVLERVIAGKPNKVIAGELAISVKTVEVHRAKVMEKSGVASVAELVQLMLQRD